MSGTGDNAGNSLHTAPVSTSPHIAIIGGGPAGLMAAEVASAGGARVTVFDRMPSVGRKFLMAGRGGLNLTHSEDFRRFVSRYREAAPMLAPLLEAFPPEALVRWANDLGAETFTGTSGRVFPKAMKASPLLRAWLRRLDAQGVVFRTRHEWRGWDDSGALLFRTPDGDVRETPDAAVLALGGASWPKLGSRGDWSKALSQAGADIAPLLPANSGFSIAWSEHLQRFAGQPLKNALFRAGEDSARGEAMITRYGIEGGAIYALSAPLRQACLANGKVTLSFDLRPERSADDLAQRLARPRGKASLANHLRRTLALSPVESALLHETQDVLPGEPAALAQRIKNVTLTLTFNPDQAMKRAISSAGGVRFGSLDSHLMLKSKPGVFIAGEMLDWEAPTGGYLLQACFATGVAAGKGALAYAGN